MEEPFDKQSICVFEHPFVFTDWNSYSSFNTVFAMIHTLALGKHEYLVVFHLLPTPYMVQQSQICLISTETLLPSVSASVSWNLISLIQTAFERLYRELQNELFR